MNHRGTEDAEWREPLRVARGIFNGVLVGILVWLFIGLVAWCCAGADVPLEWNASPSTNANGYLLFIGTNSHFAQSNAVAVIAAGETNAVWTNVAPDVTYRAYVLATNASGTVSDPSNEIEFVVPPPAGFLRVKVALFKSAGLDGPWEPVDAPCWEFETPAGANQTFFRGLVQIEGQ